MYEVKPCLNGAKAQTDFPAQIHVFHLFWSAAFAAPFAYDRKVAQ